MRQPEQVVAGTSTRVQRRRVQQCADVVQRVTKAAVRLPLDQRGAFVHRVQAQDRAHGGRLSGPVRSREAGHQPRADGKGHAVERLRGAVSLAQPGDDNPWGCATGSVWSHAAQWYRVPGCGPVSTIATWLEPATWHRCVRDMSTRDRQ